MQPAASKPLPRAGKVLIFVDKAGKYSIQFVEDPDYWIEDFKSLEDVLKFCDQYGYTPTVR